MMCAIVQIYDDKINLVYIPDVFINTWQVS